MIATANGHEKVVRILVRSGAETNVKNYMGRSPLHFAAMYGLADIAKTLVAYGADVNVLDLETRVSPLFLSAKIGDMVLAKILIEAGADVNIRDSSGKTVDFYAQQNKHGDLAKFLRELRKS